jgi:uncharacterized protein with beta-barrel porin domain
VPGGSGFDLASGSRGTDSLQPCIGAALSQKFLMEGGAKITPELRLGYAHDRFAARFLTVTTVSGAAFPRTGAAPSRDQALS